MSIVKTIDIRCDWPDCHRIGESDGIAVTAAEARQQVRRTGWGYKPSPSGHRVDLCPQHNHLSKVRPDEYAEAFAGPSPAGTPETDTEAGDAV